MVKKSKKSEKVENQRAGEGFGEGWRQATSTPGARWFFLGKGNVLRGVLLGRYERSDVRFPSGASGFYQVRLLSPCKVRDGVDEAAIVAEAEVGEVVNLYEGPASRQLRRFADEVEQGAEYEVLIECGEKLQLAKNNTMWALGVSVKRIKAPQMTDEVGGTTARRELLRRAAVSASRGALSLSGVLKVRRGLASVLERESRGVGASLEKLLGTGSDLPRSLVEADDVHRLALISSEVARDAFESFGVQVMELSEVFIDFAKVDEAAAGMAMSDASREIGGDEDLRAGWKIVLGELSRVNGKAAELARAA